MTDDLAARHCAPVAGAPLPEAEIRTLLERVPGWQLAGRAIEKTYQFSNYHETIGFVNALAWICNTEDHHPELVVSYARCTVRFDTHTVSGVSINDFICAAKADALVATRT